MIKIVIHERHRGFNSNKKEVTCPECNKRDFFFHKEPTDCYACGAPLRGVLSLMENIETRKQYYIMGEY